MGTELVTTVKIGSKKLEAKVLIESNTLIIRGVERKVIPLQHMQSVSLKSGTILFSFEKESYQIVLGDRAEKWFEKIKNPKSVMDKIGIKSDSTVAIINISDFNFINDVKKLTKKITINKSLKNTDIIIGEANNPVEAEKRFSLKKYLQSNGAIWIVSRKGKSASIKDVEVMEIGRNYGFVDVKVVSFSESHTALKFVIPVNDRK